MRILMLHQNFPGQYPHLANWAKTQKGFEVVAITDTNNKRPEIVKTYRYTPPAPLPANYSTSIVRYGEAIGRAEGAAKVSIALKERGFVPDLILGHGAWGETIYQKEVFPTAKLITYAEFYYNSSGFNTGFDLEFDKAGPNVVRTIVSQNATMQMSLQTADFGHTPTQFQASSFPHNLRSKLGVIFDGVDTSDLVPDETAQFTLPNGTILKAGDPVVTFINRSFEPYRGYHIFMRALPKILADNPHAQIIMIGGSGVSYGPAPKGDKSWQEIFLDEVRDKLDLSRVHYLGRVSPAVLKKCYQVSAAHVYLTYPFVLSWSMLEAMSAGCLVIGADVNPVREMIEHGRNGLLVPFFDSDAIANQVLEALADPDQHRPLRLAARQTVVERYDLHTICLPTQVKCYADILNGGNFGAFGAQELLADSHF